MACQIQLVCSLTDRTLAGKEGPIWKSRMRLFFLPLRSVGPKPPMNRIRTTGLTEQAGGELGGSAFACPLHLNSKHPYYQLPTKKQLSNKLTRVVAIQSSSTSNGLHIQLQLSLCRYSSSTQEPYVSLLYVSTYICSLKAKGFGARPCGDLAKIC